MTHGRNRSLLTAVSVAMLWWGACNPSTAGTPEPTKIMVKDFMFATVSLTVKAGSTVTWANMDDEPQTVVSDTGLFSYGALVENVDLSVGFKWVRQYHI